MSNKKDDLRERIGGSWREKWRIPRSDLGSVLFVFAVFALFFVWLGISVFGVEAEAIKTAHKFLPQWFFFANLFVCPALLAFAAAPLPVPRSLRLVLTALMFCSGSLFLVTRQHQAAGLAMLGFLYLEAFWIIPQWNKRARRKKSRESAHGSDESTGNGLSFQSNTGALPKSGRRSRLRDFALYAIIAVVVVTFLLIHVLR